MESSNALSLTPLSKGFGIFGFWYPCKMLENLNIIQGHKFYMFINLDFGGNHEGILCSIKWVVVL